MKIGGFQEFSLIEYSGKLSAVIFTQGCNFCCKYCHNSELITSKWHSRLISEEKVLSFLEKRTNHLESVVITGGEPTIQKDLIPFIRKVKSLGYLVKLNTNGSNPAFIVNLVKLKIVDFIAMDVKASMKNYSVLAGLNVNIEQIKKSIVLILASGIEHEFRTTVVKSLHKNVNEELQEIQGLVKKAQRFRIQGFVESPKVLDSQLLSQEQFTENEIQKFNEIYGFDHSEI